MRSKISTCAYVLALILLTPHSSVYAQEHATAPPETGVAEIAGDPPSGSALPALAPGALEGEPDADTSPVADTEGRASETATAEPTEQPPELVAEAAPAEAPARIIFFRPGALTGAIYTYHVVVTGEDGKSTQDSPRIGSLPNGGYFEHEVRPGVYHFNLRGPMSVNLAQDRVRVEAFAGATIYVEQIPRMGLVTSGFQLIPASEADFGRRRLREWKPSAE